ncbi:MAG: arabinose ABC transporter substrate-binding protein [Spirochaetaceae bacterium]
MKKNVILTICLILMTGSLFANGVKEAKSETKEIKIGFLVKMPEEGWFQQEWKFAQEAGADYGFKVIEIGTPDGEKVLSAIDNLAAQGAQGFIICTPDVKLGSAILAKANANDLKLFTVDDRLVGADGTPIQEIPHMGISAYEIGKEVGKTLASQMKERGWKQEETGFMRISFNELPTAVDRITGATDALVEMGYDKNFIFDSPQKTTDTEGAFNAANITITKNPNIKHWLITGLNDEASAGGTRALEGNGFAVEDICAVGIGGSGVAIAEFEKENLTGFYSTALLSPRRHGYETAELVYKWITTGVKPPATTWTSAAMMNRSNYIAVQKENS